jgi:hypothetical protein
MLTLPAGLPTRAALSLDALHVVLREIDPAELRDPFMQQTIARMPAADQIVSIAFDELGRAPASTAPAGLIFHVARCGSTLVSQLLKQHPGVVVYAEPLPVNEILVPPQRGNRAQLVSALRFIGALFARHAGRRYVVKFSSWNTLFCDVVAEAFPGTPWILCLRDPLEVAVSVLRERPGWLREHGAPTDPFVDWIDPARTTRSPEEYVARLFSKFCEAAGRLDPARGKLIDYAKLPDAVWTTIAPHFGLTLDARVQRDMASAARLNAKSPLGKETAFSPDDDAKRAAASPALRRAVDIIARPSLEQLRRPHSAS